MVSFPNFDLKFKTIDTKYKTEFKYSQPIYKFLMTEGISSQPLTSLAISSQSIYSHPTTSLPIPSKTKKTRNKFFDSNLPNLMVHSKNISKF